MEAKTLRPEDLRTETYSPFSKYNGSHLTGECKGVRVTHVSSGLSVECAYYKSQHKNRCSAIAKLKKQVFGD